jgi:hypothetical protein
MHNLTLKDVDKRINIERPGYTATGWVGLGE